MEVHQIYLIQWILFNMPSAAKTVDRLDVFSLTEPIHRVQYDKYSVPSKRAVNTVGVPDLIG